MSHRLRSAGEAPGGPTARIWPGFGPISRSALILHPLPRSATIVDNLLGLTLAQRIRKETMNRQFRSVLSVLYLVAALAVPFGIAAAQSASAAPKKVTSVEGITEYRLDNGLRVLLFPDPTRPKVTVNLTVLVGSRHEGYGETGMAHLLEHMLFKGTPSHRNIPAAMKERGAQFNGSTWLDRTNYFETLPDTDQNLEFAIRLEADRMINSPIKAEDLATEFSVVRNEFEMGENSPERVLSQRMMAVAYEWHNYGKSTIGNRSDIERVPVDNLRAFYKKFYQPDNAVLVVAGRFDEKKALEYISKYFGSLPRPDRKLQERPIPKSRRRTASASSRCDGSATSVWSGLALSRAGRLARRVSRRRAPGKHSRFRALGPALQGPGRIQEGHQRFGHETHRGTRPGCDRDHCRGQHQGPVGTLEKVRDVMISVVEEIARSGVTSARSGSGPPEGPQGPRAWRRPILTAIAVELSEWAAQGTGGCISSTATGSNR